MTLLLKKANNSMSAVKNKESIEATKSLKGATSMGSKDSDLAVLSKSKKNDTPEPVIAETVVAETVVAETVVAEPVVAEPVVAEPVVAEPVVVIEENPFIPDGRTKKIQGEYPTAYHEYLSDEAYRRTRDKKSNKIGRKWHAKEILMEAIELHYNHHKK